MMLMCRSLQMEPEALCPSHSWAASWPPMRRAAGWPLSSAPASSGTTRTGNNTLSQGVPWGTSPGWCRVSLGRRSGEARSPHRRRPGVEGHSTSHDQRLSDTACRGNTNKRSKRCPCRWCNRKVECSILRAFGRRRSLLPGMAAGGQPCLFSGVVQNKKTTTVTVW